MSGSRTRTVAALSLAVLIALATPAVARAEDAGTTNLESERQHEFFRTLAGGDITPERMAQMWRDYWTVPNESPVHAARARRGGPASVETQNTWQLAGPVFSQNVGGGFMTGRVRDIDAVNVRALAASGGLWRFDIFGGIPMSDSVAASWFGSFATHPTNANLILLGTGEYGYGAGTGMYRTTDGGATWSQVNLQVPAWFTKVRWSADGTVAYAADNVGLYRSTDGGVTWSQRMNGLVTDFTLVPGFPNRMFATMVGTVWSSADGGVTWGQLTTGGVPNGVGGNGAITALYSTSNSNVWIYAAFDKRIWRSQDGAVTWTEVTPGLAFNNSGYGPAISVCPNDPSTVLYGNVPCLRTTNAGASWTSIVTPHLHADYHVFAWDTDGNGVWAGNDGGWSHSTDRGVTWSSSSNAMPISQFYSIDCEKTETGYMVGGTQDNNVLYTPSPSLDWIDPQVGSTEGDASDAVIDLYNPMQMWANTGVPYSRYHTTDGGTNWSSVNSGIANPNTPGSLCTDNAFPADVFTSSDFYVYESTNGVSWSQSNGTAFTSTIRSLTASTRVTNGAVLWAALNSFTGNRLMVRDNGVWYERSTGLPTGNYVLKVIPHPWAASADEAWAILPVSGQQIWHTTNRGQTWTSVTGDLPASIPVSSLVPNPRHDGEWYAGSAMGLYRTKNGGVNWEHWNDGMPLGAMISDMSYIDLTTTTGEFWVVAATYGRSAWKREVGGEDVFPLVSVSDAYVQEGDSGQRDAVFHLILSAPQSEEVDVDWSTQDSTATVADNDYVASGGRIGFVPGQTDQIVLVPINGDTNFEPDEVFKLVLANPLRAGLGDPGVGHILDDDAHALVCHDLWITDGAVNAIATSGNTLYLGGAFSNAGPATGHGVPIDATTGLPLALPKVDGAVIAVAADGSGGWFVGGNFAHVGGMPRSNLAHVLADGSPDPNWSPNATGLVQAMIRNGNRVYVSGSFTSIDGVPRQYVAALDATNGAVTTFNPSPDAPVYTFALSGTQLYMGGYFTQMYGKRRRRAAAVTLSTSTLSSWDPSASGEVDALLVDGSVVYAAGQYDSIGGQPRARLAALDATTGTATAWNPAPDQPVWALAAGSAGIYAGGDFANIGGQNVPWLAVLDRSTGGALPWLTSSDGSVNALEVNGTTVYAAGSFAHIGGQARAGLAALATGNGAASSWDPGANSTVGVVRASGGAVFIGGNFTSLHVQPRAHLAAFDLTTGQLLPWNPGADNVVRALLAGPGVVYAGGSFANAGGQPRNRVAAIDSVTALATSWDPNANGTVFCLSQVGTRIVAGGQFTSIGGQTRNRIAALSTSTGAATSWNPNANNTVGSVVTDGTFVYAGGAFTAIGGQARTGLAALDATAGAAITNWNAQLNGSVTALMINGSALYVGGTFSMVLGTLHPRLALLDLSRGTVSPWAPTPDDYVSAIVQASSGQVYVGGAFKNIGGTTRDHLALLRVGTNQVSNWAPQPSGNVNALALAGSTLYVGGGFATLGGLPQTNFGCVIPTTAVDVPESPVAAEFSLHLAPNPTAGLLKIDYVLPEAARVTVSVFDVGGRRVGPALDVRQPAGPNRLEWDGRGARGVSPGVYFVHVTAGTRSVVRRVVIL